MTVEDVKDILKNHPDRISICAALACVNLSDREQDVLILRYMRGMTQERTAEAMGETVSVNTVFSLQQSALDKTARLWSKLPLAKILHNTIHETAQ